jgi:hypothetical protein
LLLLLVVVVVQKRLLVVVAVVALAGLQGTPWNALEHRVERRRQISSTRNSSRAYHQANTRGDP